MWPSKDEIEEHRKKHAFFRGSLVGAAIATLFNIVAGICSAEPVIQVPPAPTGQTFCVVEPGYPAVLCAIVDVKEA